MKVSAALAVVLDVLLGLRAPRAREPGDDAELAYEMFRDGFDSCDIARGLGLPEWQVLVLLADGRSAATRSAVAARPA